MILFIKHISVEAPGYIGEYFERRKDKCLTVDLSSGAKLPRTLEGIRAVIALGGPMNVYEEEKYPFLKNEDRFIKELIEADVPYMGICLGSQLLAKAAGAVIRKAPEKEIGFYQVKLTDKGKKDGIFSGVKSPLSIFQWHEDTFDVPKSGILLATADTCANQCFRIGRNMYGFQFHFEVNKGIIDEWIREHDEKVPDTVMNSRFADMEERYGELAGIAERICTNFAFIADKRREYANKMDIL